MKTKDLEKEIKAAQKKAIETRENVTIEIGLTNNCINNYPDCSFDRFEQYATATTGEIQTDYICCH